MRVVEVVHGPIRGGITESLWRRIGSQAWTAESMILAPPARSQELLETNLPAPLIALSDDPDEWRATIQGLKPQVVVSHSPASSIPLLLKRPDPTRDPPVVVVAHSMSVPSRPTRRYAVESALALVNRRAALHVAVSGAVARGPLCRGSTKTVVISPGVRACEARPDGPSWPPRIILPGRLVKGKGHVDFLKALAAQQHYLPTGTALDIAGDGPLFRDIQERLERTGLSRMAKLTGFVDDLKDSLWTYTHAVIPSRSEGGPLTALEALAGGLRIAGREVGLLPDLAKSNCGVALIGRRLDIPDWPAWVRSLAAEGPLSAEERLRRSTRAREHWDSDSAARRFQEQLRRILE